MNIKVSRYLLGGVGRAAKVYIGVAEKMKRSAQVQKQLRRAEYLRGTEIKVGVTHSGGGHVEKRTDGG